MIACLLQKFDPVYSINIDYDIKFWSKSIWESFVKKFFFNIFLNNFQFYSYRWYYQQRLNNNLNNN